MLQQKCYSEANNFKWVQNAEHKQKNRNRNVKNSYVDDRKKNVKVSLNRK